MGLMLGDGHLETQNNGRTYRLKVEHSVSQLDYTEWLFKVFAPLCAQMELYRKNKNNKEYVGFRTRSLGMFRFYAQQFYHKKKKVMPKIIGKLLSKTSIAIWYLDDGSKKSVQHKTYVIHTLGFTRSELLRAQKALLEKFLIVVSLHRQKGKYYRLYIPHVSALQFKKIVESYVARFCSMRHKL